MHGNPAAAAAAGAFSTLTFLVGAVTSILSGYLGMTIAVYANARTALQARKGIAPAFMCGASRCCGRGAARRGTGCGVAMLG